MQAIIDTNTGQHLTMGNDIHTQALNATFSDLFEHNVLVYTVASGSAANSLALASICPPHGSIYCHELAHIQRDEAGAPEFFTGGAKMETLTGPFGKIDPEAMEARLATVFDVYYMVQPYVLSLTQATEMGTLYTEDEMRRLVDIAHCRNMRIHLDGARLANAVVASGRSWA
ncbi:MAG: beta-eliminating lyase-related protein, partial [Jannaschia sp.]